MPIYEYNCPSCGKAFEELAPMARADSVKCPSCGRKAARKPSVFGVSMAPDRPAVPAGCGGCHQAGGSCPYKQ